MSADSPYRPFLSLLVVILVLVTAVDLVGVLRITNNHDFAVYYRAAVRLRTGSDIYAETDAFRAHIESGVSTSREDTPWPYAYPPFLALVLIPLSLLPYAWTSALWTALCLAALALSCWLILRSQDWLTMASLAVVLLLMYQFQPMVVGVRLGQIDIVVFLLFVLALVWLKSGEDGKAGLALGLAIGAKLFAGFLVAFLLWKRRWRAAVIAAASGGIFLVGSFALVGLEALKRYLDFSSLYTRGPFAGYFYHQSFNAFFTRAFKPNIFLAPIADLPWLADALTAMLSLLTLAAFAWLTRRPVSPQESRFDMEYALAIATMLLVVPPAPRYSFVWLMLGFIVAAAHLVRHGGSRWLIGLLGVAYILTARLVYFPVPLLRRLVMDGQFMLGTMLLWLALAWLLWQAEQQKGGM